MAFAWRTWTLRWSALPAFSLRRVVETSEDRFPVAEVWRHLRGAEACWSAADSSQAGSGGSGSHVLVESGTQRGDPRWRPRRAAAVDKDPSTDCPAAEPASLR